MRASSETILRLAGLGLAFLAALFVALPALAMAAAPNSAAMAKLAGAPAPRAASLEAMAGAMIMAGFRGLELKEGDPFLEAVRAGSVGHVILFDKDVSTGSIRNIASPDQLRALTAALKAAAPGPLLVAVDQEGGTVRRLKPEAGFNDFPSARTLGRGRPENTRILARRLGIELASLGIDVDLAPVADLDTNPANPVIGKLQRSFGPDPAVVSKHVLAFGQALQSVGVIPVIKHFPGHGSSSVDSHTGVADITPAWSSRTDLKPYVDAFRADWPGMVMVGHLTHTGLDPQYPATLSRRIVHDLLRVTLGWDGVVISDDMQMQAITAKHSLEEAIMLAVNAGVDILVFGNNLSWDPDLPAKAHATLVRLVQEKKIPRERIAESWRRIALLYDAYHGGIELPVRVPLTRIH